MDNIWSGSMDATTRKIVMSVAALVIIMFVAYLAQVSARRYIEDAEAKFRTRKWIKNLSYIISLLVLAAIFSDQLGGLAVFLGAVGVGIAFALQEVIASFAGWLAVSVGKFYRSGDRVQLGGIKGDVIDISVIRTTLMEIGEWVDADTHTGRIVRIANSFVFKEPVFNYTSNFPFLWDEIKLPVKHGSDQILARNLLHRIGADLTAPAMAEARLSWIDLKRKYFIDEVMLEPQVFMKITDNWLEFTLRYIVHYRERRSTKDLIYTRVLADIESYPDRIAIASATVALVEIPPVKLQPNPTGPSAYNP